MLLAQTITAIPDIDPTVALGSMAGVMFSTTIIVSLLIKPYLSKVKALANVPLIVFSLAVSLALTVIGNKVLHVLPGTNLLSLLIQTALGAMGAAGIYHVPGSTQSLADTANSVLSLFATPSAPAATPSTTASATTVSTTTKVGPLILLSLISSIIMLCGGCATSAGTQSAIAAVGPSLAANATQYATSLPDPAKTTQLNAIAPFKAAVSVAVSKISGPTVKSLWAAVEPEYTIDINSDATLSATEKSLRLQVVQSFDKLLADDAARPFAGFALFP